MSKRDELARIVYEARTEGVTDHSWTAARTLILEKPDDPLWCAGLPIRKAYDAADRILAWLAEPAQVEAMAKASFERDGYNWASWCADEPDLANECLADIRAALAALVPPAKET